MSKGTVLILGAGLVTKPLVHYLANHDFHVILASRTLSNAQKLVEGLNNAEAVQYDITSNDTETLTNLIKKSVAVVSMLPYIYHPIAAKLAIEHKKHFFTTSYVSDAMRALEEDAKKAGVIIINECGVDPGSDHMSAQKVIDSVHAKGGQVVYFTSYCGGLPRPQDNDNPLGYKFSWAPRGVLLAAKNDAIFLRDGEKVHIPAGTLYDNTELFEIPNVGKFEGYGNRNSLNYVDIYKIPEAKTLIRGTFRYEGWCKALRKLIEIGWLSDKVDESMVGKTYRQIMAESIGEPDSTDVKKDTADRLGLSVDDKIISTFEWLGLFSDEKVTEKTYIDALVASMLPRMKYTEGQQDMIVMQHKLIVEYPAEKKKQTIFSRLICYGDETGTAMARTVSFPVAIAIRLVLEGHVKLAPGLHIPNTPELYNPILEELATLGINFTEEVSEEAL